MQERNIKASVVKLIEVKGLPLGKGEPHSPFREATTYYTKDGKLIALIDTCGNFSIEEVSYKAFLAIKSIEKDLYNAGFTPDQIELIKEKIKKVDFLNL